MSRSSGADQGFVVRPGARAGYVLGNTLWPVTVLERMRIRWQDGSPVWVVVRDAEYPEDELAPSSFPIPESALQPLPDPSLYGMEARVYLGPPARPRRPRPARRKAAPA